MNRISKTILKLVASSAILFLTGWAYAFVFDYGSSGEIVSIGFFLFLGGYLAHRFLELVNDLLKWSFK